MDRIPPGAGWVFSIEYIHPDDPSYSLQGVGGGEVPEGVQKRGFLTPFWTPFWDPPIYIKDRFWSKNAQNKIAGNGHRMSKSSFFVFLTPFRGTPQNTPFWVFLGG